MEERVVENSEPFDALEVGNRILLDKSSAADDCSEEGMVGNMNSIDDDRCEMR